MGKPKGFKKLRRILQKRKAKEKEKAGWLKAADMGLFAGFASPIAHHLGLLSLAWALTATFLGLALSALSVWGWMKTKEEDIRKEREERAWWS